MKDKLQLQIKSFDKLTTTELYEILRLRSEVFVVEQDCVYQDIDYKDEKSIHLFYSKGKKIVGYTRLFKPGDYFKEASIGRVVIQENFRKDGLGHLLIQESIKSITELFKTSAITISAQLYLKKFYEKHGFIQQGVTYLEDGIPHIKMML